MLLIIPDYIQITKIEEKYVILDCRNNYYYAVSQSGVKLLEQIKIHGDLTKSIEKISSDYKVSMERVREDILVLVQQLIEKGLIMEQ
jgi:hypothetical protein